MKGLLLRAGSLAWSGASLFAREAVKVGWLKPARLGVRVVSVGNIQAGGAGKTPIVACIAREARERNLKVCILSRGYRGQWEKHGGVLLPAGSGQKVVRAEICGDEPALLHELVPEAVIGVGANRIRQFQAAVAQAGPVDLVLLDDGFQHWRVHRDLDVVAVTGARPGDVLFRESARALSLARLLVWTKGSAPPVGGRPVVKVRFSVPSSNDTRPLWLVSGVARPREAWECVSAAGYRIARHLAFEDHARYTAEQAASLLNGARAAGAVLALTGKDWVKWRDHGVSRDEVLVLEPELVFEEGRELWNRELWGL